MIKREFKTINQLIEENDNFISVIPNAITEYVYKYLYIKLLIF